jgi:hypothetical protein
MYKKQESYDESKRGQNENKHILQFQKMFFFYYSFFTGPLTLHLKDDL